MPKSKAGVLKKVCAQCATPFEVPDKVNYREKQYCTRACSNVATAAKRAESIRAAKRYTPPICPCGEEIQPPPGQTHVYANQKKYCSAECRKKYAVWRQKDPANHVTFNCANCETEVTRPRTYGGGQSRYCSISCARKHTKTKQHILVDDATVLDSGYEALFWGLCRFHKVPIERYDREQGVEWSKGCWYAPDFLLPSLDVAVELKGVQDPEDEMRWEAYTEQRGALVVLLREDLEALLCGRGALLAVLGNQSGPKG